MFSGSRRNHPYKLYGLVLLGIVAGLTTLSVLAFRQAFTPVTHVRVHVAQAGLQLLPGSDVKVRGLIVGDVGDITSNGSGADLDLRLNPAEARQLPGNVTVRMLPKTLFGEKYVDLVLPAQPSGQLRDGTVIAADQTKTTLEIDQALNDLLPVLRTVPPAQLNHTLTALATALTGRGEQLGQTIEQLDRYLAGITPHLPQLGHDMSALAGVAHTYATAADPLLRMLGNLTVTSRTVVDERAQLQQFLSTVTGVGDETRDLFRRNGRNLVAVNAVNRKVLATLAHYSPEYPCFVKGYAKLVPRIHDAVPSTPGLNHAAHVVVEFVPAFPTYQYPIDLPAFHDKRGPHCYGLPNPARSLPVIRYKDGTEDDPRFDAQGGSSGKAARSGGRTGATSRSEPLTPLDTILGPLLGVRSDSVPDIADLLWGPLAAGAAVNVR